MHKILFYNKFISFLYMFPAHVQIIRRSKLYYTASGIITPIGGRPVHKTKFCASSWLINKVNILKCLVSKTSETMGFERKLRMVGTTNQSARDTILNSENKNSLIQRKKLSSFTKNSNMGPESTSIQCQPTLNVESDQPDLKSV